MIPLPAAILRGHRTHGAKGDDSIESAAAVVSNGAVSESFQVLHSHFAHWRNLKMTEGMSSSEVSPLGTVPITEIDILWLTAGLGCDGDTIAVTAATQPSIEDIIRAAYIFHLSGF